jgi:uncharacterized membrane protein
MTRKLASTLLVILALCGLLQAQANEKESNSPQTGKGTLDVIVVDEEGKPLSGVLVSVPGYRSTTGLAGTCRFGLLPGRYAVLISKSGYRGRRVNAGVRPNETTTTRVTLQKLPPRRSPEK